MCWIVTMADCHNATVADCQNVLYIFDLRISVSHELTSCLIRCNVIHHAFSSSISFPIEILCDWVTFGFDLPPNLLNGQDTECASPVLGSYCSELSFVSFELLLPSCPVAAEVKDWTGATPSVSSSSSSSSSSFFSFDSSFSGASAAFSLLLLSSVCPMS